MSIALLERNDKGVGCRPLVFLQSDGAFHIFEATDHSPFMWQVENNNKDESTETIYEVA